MKKILEARRSDSGQAVLELTLCVPAVLSALFGAALLLRAEWSRVQCAYQVFEAAHQALRGSPGSLTRLVKIEQTDDGISATAQCGSVTETVALPNLENAVWGTTNKAP